MNDYSFTYNSSGDRGILLVHGLTGSPSEMRFIGKTLHKQGFTVVCPTLAGHGKTVADLVKTKWQDWYASVEYAYYQLCTQVEEVYIGGLSMGALMALRLAAKHPAEIKGIALYSTTLTYDGWNIPYTRVLLPLLPLVVKIPILRNLAFTEAHPFGIKDERMRNRIVKQMYDSKSSAGGLPSTPFLSLRELRRLIDVVKRDLPTVTTPTLIIHASEDDMCSISNAYYISQHIGGTHQLHLLDNSYHMITVDQERDKVSQLTADFFNALSNSYSPISPSALTPAISPQ